MKHFFILILIVFPFFLIAQEKNSSKHELGINLTYSGFDGLGASFRYKLKRLKFEINSNFNNSLITRVGYEFLSLQKNEFELGLGLDIAYNRISESRIGLSDYDAIFLEVPLELKYNITPKVSLMVGTSFSLLKIKEDDRFQQDSSPSEIRLGAGFKF